MQNKNIKYRPEIDGLRALAVVSVIIYHAEIYFRGYSFFQGGFLGVDIFFVISGYLISKIIINEVNINFFSFLKFYEKRARRILPLLFTVILFSFPFAWNRMLPSQFVEYSESIISSLFFVSNIFFYFTASTYGAESSLFKPFLHTWSLGIEEQFYIFFPILLIFTYKYLRNFVLHVFVIILISSFFYGVYVSKIDYNFSFYFSLTRFWEIIFGSILTYIELKFKKNENKIINNLMPLIGLCIIFLSIYLFDDKSPISNFKILFCISGVGLIIIFSSTKDITTYILSFKPFVFLGLISYSMYLWHFPVMAFGRLQGHQTNFDKLLWLSLIFLLSILSYYLIERPFRDNLIIISSTFWKIIIFVFIIILSIMGYVIYNKGIENRFNVNEYNFIKHFDKPEYLTLNDENGPCRMRNISKTCRSGKEKIIFLGDSFVGHYQRATNNVLSKLNLGYISLSYEQCPFVGGNIWFGDVPNCPFINKNRKNEILNFKDKKIFITAINEQQFEYPKAISETLEGIKSITPESNIIWKSYLDNLKWIQSLGHKIIVIGTIPRPQLKSKMWLLSNKKYIEDLSFPNIKNNSKPSIIIKNDKEFYSALKSENIKIIYPTFDLCDLINDTCFDVMNKVGPIYNGGRHLSYYGSLLIANRIKNLIIENKWNEM